MISLVWSFVSVTSGCWIGVGVPGHPHWPPEEPVWVTAGLSLDSGTEGWRKSSGRTLELFPWPLRAVGQSEGFRVTLNSLLMTLGNFTPPKVSVSPSVTGDGS